MRWICFPGGNEGPTAFARAVLVIGPQHRVGVVVVAFGTEPQLDACLLAIRRSRGIHVALAVVDNGCTNPDFRDIVKRHEARLVQPADNVGFAQGCNLGVSSLTDISTVALVNSDAVVDEDALRYLADALSDEVGVATASVRLAQAPHLVNSTGNPVHYTGVSWAGGFGDQAAHHVARRDVAAASGAGMAVSLALWEQLGGFDPCYFTYLEDTELSLRCWLAERRVVYVPEAIVLHHYEFSRNRTKHYYLERNRLLLLLTLYERRTLILLTPALLFWEACVTLGALAQGWFPSKVRGWLWLITNSQHVRDRRHQIQSSRHAHDGALVALLEDRLEPRNMTLPRGFQIVDRALACYWRLVRHRITGYAAPGAPEVIARRRGSA